jgi:hypothetical protein
MTILLHCDTEIVTKSNLATNVTQYLINYMYNDRAIYRNINEHKRLKGILLHSSILERANCIRLLVDDIRTARAMSPANQRNRLEWSYGIGQSSDGGRSSVVDRRCRSTGGRSWIYCPLRSDAGRTHQSYATILLHAASRAQSKRQQLDSARRAASVSGASDRNPRSLPAARGRLLRVRAHKRFGSGRRHGPPPRQISNRRSSKSSPSSTHYATGALRSRNSRPALTIGTPS